LKFLFKYIFIIIITTACLVYAANEKEYKDIGYEKYMHRVNVLNSRMQSLFLRYENNLTRFMLEVQKRSCINERLIVLKTLINSAENEVSKMKESFFSFEREDVDEMNFEKTYLSRLGNFYKIYSKFQFLSIQIDSCVLKYDKVVEEDGAQVIEYYKRQ